MPKRLLALVCLCLFFIDMPSPSYAEGLNDVSIRALYAKTAAIVDDPEKMLQMMEDKLDDHFTLKSNLTQIIGDGPPQTTVSTFDKTKAIDNALRGYSVMQVDHYQNKVTGIKYSDDHKYATVTDTTASSGIINVPVPEGGYAAIRYEDGEGCVDQLTLAEEKIKFLQSVCNEKFVVGK